MQAQPFPPVYIFGWLVQLDLRMTQRGSPPAIADVPPPTYPHISLTLSSLYTPA